MLSCRTGAGTPGPCKLFSRDYTHEGGVNKGYKPRFMPTRAINRQPSLRFDVTSEEGIVLRESCSEKDVKGSNSNDGDASMKNNGSGINCERK